MNKIAILAAILLIFINSACAREISFIYINGSNNNDQKTRDWFLNGINKFHPELKKNFENDDFATKKFLLNHKDTIKNDPTPFYWGEMSQIELQEFTRKLESVKKISPKTTQFAREHISLWMHDAIWVTKYSNMEPITEKLHNVVMSEYKNGNQIVLLGYSAGSFVSYDYMLKRSKYIVPSDFLSKLDAPEEVKKYIASTKIDNTCTTALKKSKLAFIDSSGGILLNQDFNQVKAIYPNLNDYSDKYCLPDDAVKGVINYGSPFSLFYSEIADLSKITTIKSKLLYIYLLKTDKFLITVNWANDPLSFPVGKNLTFADVQERFDMALDHNLGYVYDKSDQKSRTIFLRAHNSYWRNSKRFAKSVVKAYKEGYFNYYR